MNPIKNRLLFVDDEQNFLDSLQRLLRRWKAEWEMQFVDCPLKALELLQREPFDTVVCDLHMPRMSGLQMLEQMQQCPRIQNIPVIILTGDGRTRMKIEALELGATDLLSKNTGEIELFARIRSALRLKECLDSLRLQNEYLEQRVEERTANLLESQLDIVWRLGIAGEYRDHNRGRHVARVGAFSRLVARELGLDDEKAERMLFAAPLHDIGKIGIPDAILRKPAKLTEEEMAVMREHCVIGEAILKGEWAAVNAFAEWSGVTWVTREHRLGNPVLDMASTIARSHHERWDGSGYPDGLVATEIPLEGRIVALADLYDALRSKRHYKQAYSRSRSLDILRESAGSHIDPDVYQAFIRRMDEIVDIERRLSDETFGLEAMPAEATV